jgi:predicted transcriptional regulator
MTELLEQAIAAVRRLPATEQDAAAEFLFDFVARHSPPEPLDSETRAAILEGCAQADRGEFVSDEEMAAFFARHRA